MVCYVLAFVFERFGLQTSILMLWKQCRRAEDQTWE